MTRRREGEALYLKQLGLSRHLRRKEEEEEEDADLDAEADAANAVEAVPERSVYRSSSDRVGQRRRRGGAYRCTTSQPE